MSPSGQTTSYSGGFGGPIPSVKTHDAVKPDHATSPHPAATLSFHRSGRTARQITRMPDRATDTVSLIPPLAQPSPTRSSGAPRAWCGRMPAWRTPGLDQVQMQMK